MFGLFVNIPTPICYAVLWKNKISNRFLKFFVDNLKNTCSTSKAFTIGRVLLTLKCPGFDDKYFIEDMCWFRWHMDCHSRMII